MKKKEAEYNLLKVVGLAVARELAKREVNLLVVEKAMSFGQETSLCNSEVIHGGMYYPVQTLKAKVCVEGRRFSQSQPF